MGQRVCPPGRWPATAAPSHKRLTSPGKGAERIKTQACKSNDGNWSMTRVKGAPRKHAIAWGLRPQTPQFRNLKSLRDGKTRAADLLEIALTAGIHNLANGAIAIGQTPPRSLRSFDINKNADRRFRFLDAVGSDHTGPCLPRHLLSAA